MVLLACDVGGTFTDCVLFDPGDGRLATHKVPTTRDDPSKGAIRGFVEILDEAGVPPARVTHVAHGTTVATNALLTRRGAKVALVTNEGFEDLLEIARQDRPSLYDLSVGRPPPLVPRASRFGIPGRLDPEGREVEPLSPEALRALSGRLAGHDAVAVVLLHSYANPAHEQALRPFLSSFPVSLSSDVSPEFREYERASTTVANAFLLPVMRRYLEGFEEGLRTVGIRAPLFLFESAGGILSPRLAARRPVSTVLSGPAGGAAFCGALARASAEPRLLGFDMGGTSTDLCVVLDGAVRETSEGEIGGLPIRTPMLDVTTIGAGGGSLARVDEGGLLKVGPESAAAVPGPACSGRGGTEPSVTYAHVVLGHLRTLLGGRFELETKAAERAVSHIANALGCGIEEAAQGILDVADANMLAAARLATTARGHDPRDFALVAFGGAGPLHAVALARGLGIGRVLVPTGSGVACAIGLLSADLRRDGVRTWLRPDVDGAPEALAALAKEVHADLVADGFSFEGTRTRYICDARYRGQSFELPIPLATPEDVRSVAGAFPEAHARAFGYDVPGAAVEIVNLRVTVTASLPARVDPMGMPESAGKEKGAGRSRRRMVVDGTPVEADVWPRGALSPGDRLEGPAVVEDAGSTLLVPTGATLVMDARGTLLVDVSGGKE
ncbi:MAG: hydantoinase/oxoprolinase family protein [Methanobacteriota archaeon]